MNTCQKEIQKKKKKGNSGMKGQDRWRVGQTKRLKEGSHCSALINQTSKMFNMISNPLWFTIMYRIYYIISYYIILYNVIYNYTVIKYMKIMRYNKYNN